MPVEVRWWSFVCGRAKKEVVQFALNGFLASWSLLGRASRRAARSREKERTVSPPTLVATAAKTISHHGNAVSLSFPTPESVFFCGTVMGLERA